MPQIKKRKYFPILLLIIAFLLTLVSIIAEDAWFEWFNPGGGGCGSVAQGGIGDGTQSFTSSVPAGCCSSVGSTSVRFCTNAGCTGTIGAYYCNCADGTTQSQGCGLCGTRTRTCSGGNWGSWGSCTGEGVCSPGQTQSQGCGLCGTQSRTCTSSCAWGSWGSCTGEGVCSPGQTQSQGCGLCGTQTRTCTASCAWDSWSSCTGQGVCSPGSKQCSGAWVQTCSFSCAWTNTQNCDSSDGWYNTGGAYACCDGNNACSSCQNQEYRDYYCSGQSCTYSVTGTQTVKSSCTNCDSSDRCSGDSYLDYYCSGGACTYTSDVCSDCSCSCGGYNVAESIANGNCADVKDNNCNGESDYDSSDGRPGDSGCPVGVTSIFVSSSTPIVGTSITADCTSSVAGVNSISASVDGVGSCSWQSWSGNVAMFSCPVGSSFGSRTVRCYVDTAKSYKSGSDQTKTINVLASACSDYGSSPYCDGDSRCDWCLQCGGVKYTGGLDRCVNAGSCPSPYCWKDKCGASCDTTQGGCPADYCSGTDYVTYSCSSSCSCVSSSDSCVDCSCSCGGYNVAESTANGNCADVKDNDCDTFTDNLDPDCPGCPPPYQVCSDGSCLPDCPTDPPCNNNGICDSGEGCTCEDCNSKKDSCREGSICDSYSKLCSCPVGTSLCADGTCKAVCDVVSGCDEDGVCDAGEGCSCSDCDGKQGSCIGDGVCDSVSDKCACPVGTSLCADGTCNADCSANPSCNSNGICESGEGCTCGDCYGKEDDCINGAVCDSAFGLCACSGKQLCPDGTCKDACNICGNGILEAGEECDGLTLPPEIQDCSNIDTLKGSISCTDCFITGCTDGAATCGDDVIQTGETCDNINLDGKTCASFGFDKGELTCFSNESAQECHFDTAGCFDEPAGCDKDGTCDASETCACEDCLNKKANECIYGQVCDNTARCKCEDGATLCGDGTCRPPTLCDTLPGCKGNQTNSVCESGEGCDCPDCEAETDTCKSSSTCINEVCTACAILKADWTETCIGSGKKVSMIVEGTPGCAGRTVTLELREQDTWPNSDDVVKSMLAIFGSNQKATYEWTTEFYDEGISPNDLGDAKKHFDTPPKDSDEVLEYYFIAKIGGEAFQSEDILKVHYCIPECDEDCDTFIDNDKQNNIVNGKKCKDLEDYGYEKDEKIVIDANSKSGYCEDCLEDGLSPGQETCAAHYDCTPEWWVKEGVPYPGPGSASDASFYLDWGDCGTVSDLTRQRLICPPGLTKEQCCGDPDSDGDFQEHCYCKVPDAETMVEFSCDNPDFRPTEIKACLAEEKFPFFTNMNMLIAVLVLIGFYIWKNRTQEKTKKRK